MKTSCQTAARWIRLRAKALWLAARVWKLTRELREKRQRILEQHGESK